MPKKPVAVTLRKPQAPADLETFVAGQKPAAPARPAPPNPLDAAAVVEHAARDYREMTLYLPTEVARDLSFYCMDRNCDVNRVVADAVTKHVAPHGTETVSQTPHQTWGTKLDVLIAHSRSRVEKLNALWALRPWAV